MDNSYAQAGQVDSKQFLKHDLSVGVGCICDAGGISRRHD